MGLFGDIVDFVSDSIAASDGLNTYVIALNPERVPDAVENSWVTHSKDIEGAKNIARINSRVFQPGEDILIFNRTKNQLELIALRSRWDIERWVSPAEYNRLRSEAYRYGRE